MAARQGNAWPRATSDPARTSKTSKPGCIPDARGSAKSKTANAIDYLLKRWPAFTRFLEDGRVCISNNAAERTLRGIAVGRKNWTFAGSDEGGRRTAAMYTLIESAKLNGIDPCAWLADVLARLPGHPASRIYELLPWHWQKPEPISVAA